MKHVHAARLLASLLLVAVAVAIASPAEAAHPYYEDQLRRGSAALARGDHDDAVRSLRLAAFGLLDEPPTLARCLVRLALAQRALGDVESSRQTVTRLLDLEERFQAYDGADLEPELGARFESLLIESVPAERLRSIPAFRHAAHQRVVEEVERLLPRQRAERLEQLLIAEPDEAQWPLMLARLEHAGGRYARAIALVDRVLALSPQDAGAFCVRGLAHAGAGDCSAAGLDLERCDRTMLDASIAWTHLDCLVREGRWVESASFLAALPPAMKTERRMRKLERQVERNQPAAPPAASPEPGSQVADAGAGVQPTSDEVPPANAPPANAPETASAPPALPAADAARLAQARQGLAQARTVSDLAGASALASDVADRHPRFREAQLLAGEIAYRSSRWSEAASYFRRAGITSGERPELLFYFAVALWESGEPVAAAVALEPALPRLRRTDFVNGYIAKILGPDR